MTVDEAIAKYNKLANNDRTCHPEEAQQLAEWLEELKELKKSAPNRILYTMGHKAGYNKAIDDFANTLKENYDYLPQILSQEAFGGYIDEYAEQLKAGGENENYNKEES